LNDKKNFVVGVLGVATNATVNFFEQWAKVFPAEKEWDRPRIIIDNNCTMPSRVRALLYNENFDLLVKQMTDSFRLLIQAGCSKVLIACNTAHVFLPSIYEKFPAAQSYVVNIIDNCASHLQSRGVKKICVRAGLNVLPRRPKNFRFCTTLLRLSSKITARRKSNARSSTSRGATVIRGGHYLGLYRTARAVR